MNTLHRVLVPVLQTLSYFFPCIYEIDLVVKDADGKYVGIEVKSGNAKRTKQQKAIDDELNAAGGFDTVGKKAKDAKVKNISRVEVYHVDGEGKILKEVTPGVPGTTPEFPAKCPFASRILPSLYRL